MPMKLETVAAALGRWGGGSANAAEGSYHHALRAARVAAQPEEEEGLDVLLAIAVGLFVASTVIHFQRWLQMPSREPVDMPGDESPVSDARSRGERSFATMVFGDLSRSNTKDAPSRPTKEELLEDLLDTSFQDLLWVLKGVQRSRGSEVLEEAMRPASVRRSSLIGGIMRSATNIDHKETERLALPQLRFSSFQYYAEEGEELTVRVVRIGDVSQRSVVPYRTRDASAKAVLNYVPLSGVLVFEPEEHTKELRIQINENDFYGPSLELTVELSAEGLENGRLDKDLSNARVEIMDNDFFPTNAYAEEIEPDSLVKDDSALKELDQTRLLFEFIRFCMSDSVIFWGMLRMVLTDQLENIYGFVNLIMTVYLVDYVVVSSVPESSLFIGHNREVSLVVVTACLVLPVVGLHLLNYLRNFWGVSGRARTTLQTALLRKFLDYSEDVRSEVHQSDIILATSNDAFELVDGGLLKTLVFFKMLGAVFMLVLFQFVAPVIFDRPIRLWLLACVLLVPAVTALIAKCRMTVSSRYLEKKYDSALELTTMVHETVVCYPLIADYNRRPLFVDRFDKLIQQHNKACVDLGCVLANNGYLASWLTVLSVGTFTFFGGMLVISGTMTLGIFLANVKIFRDVGDTCQEVYRVWLEMQQVLPPLIRITRLLNLPIDIDERKALSDLREKITREALAAVPAEDRNEVANTMPITMQDIKINFHNNNRAVDLPGRIAIEPGSLTAVVGPRGSGKSTFLKVLGGAILPNPDDFFIPSHLTVLHVQPEPLFFSGSLMDNLLFGIIEPHNEEVKSRALRICRRLGLEPDVLSKIESEEVLPWSSVLSFSQKALLNLARALVCNPHILLIHRPADYLDEATQSAIMAVLHSFVKHRGIEQDDVAFPLEFRPPHTCILTTTSLSCLEGADKVICISKEHGITTVPKDKVTVDMLR